MENKDFLQTLNERCTKLIAEGNKANLWVSTDIDFRYSEFRVFVFEVMTGKTLGKTIISKRAEDIFGEGGYERIANCLDAVEKKFNAYKEQTIDIKRERVAELEKQIREINASINLMENKDD